MKIPITKTQGCSLLDNKGNFIFIQSNNRLLFIDDVIIDKEVNKRGKEKYYLVDAKFKIWNNEQEWVGNLAEGSIASLVRIFSITQLRADFVSFHRQFTQLKKHYNFKED